MIDLGCNSKEKGLSENVVRLHIMKLLGDLEMALVKKVYKELKCCEK